MIRIENAMMVVTGVMDAQVETAFLDAVALLGITAIRARLVLLVLLVLPVPPVILACRAGLAHRVILDLWDNLENLDALGNLVIQDRRALVAREIQVYLANLESLGNLALWVPWAKQAP